MGVTTATATATGVGAVRMAGAGPDPAVFGEEPDEPGPDRFGGVRPPPEVRHDVPRPSGMPRSPGLDRGRHAAVPGRRHDQVRPRPAYRADDSLADGLCAVIGHLHDLGDPVVVGQQLAGRREGEDADPGIRMAVRQCVDRWQGDQQIAEPAEQLDEEDLARLRPGRIRPLAGHRRSLVSASLPFQRVLCPFYPSGWAGSGWAGRGIVDGHRGPIRHR